MIIILQRCFVLLQLAFCAIATSAEIGPGDDLEGAVSSPQPGEELLLMAGTCDFDENVTLTANGTLDQPIIIRAKGPEPAINRQATTEHNAIEIRSFGHVTFRDLVFTGGSHGIRLIDADFVTIEGCEIDESSYVAISANSKGTCEGPGFLGTTSIIRTARARACILAATATSVVWREANKN